jgi:cysteine desulfurase
MRIEPHLARGAVRLSLGWSSTERDVDAVVAALPKVVERLRSLDPR